jgi:ribosomal protein L37AE/L43A
MKPFCYKIEKLPSHMCDCGKPAVKRLASQWICKRCSDISARMNGIQIACGKRGSRHADTFAVAAGARFRA